MKKGITVVTITTPVPVDNYILTNILELLKTDATLSNVEFKTKVDEKLIGGFVLQYGDKMFDTSIARALEVIDDNFLDNSYIKKY